MTKRVLNILSIDGGGIKGLYSASVLCEIEKQGFSISDNFDLISGTSTGGIIALALAAGLSPEEIKTFYVEKGPKIFEPRTLKFNKRQSFLAFALKQICPNLFKNDNELSQHLFSAKYDNINLKSALNDIFGDKKLEDAKFKLCIPAINCKTGDPKVFKTPHLNFYADKDLLMSEVALATSAAPTFFPLAVINSSNVYTDGGLWANNPALVSLIEAKRIIKEEIKDPSTKINILSIASGPSTCNRHYEGVLDKSIKEWFLGEMQLIDFILHSQSKSIQFQMNLLKESEGLNYFRIPEPNVDQNQQKNITLDNCDEKALNCLIEFGQIAAQNNMTEIKSFFENIELVKI